MPKISPLMAVHRHTAASASISPWTRGQQGSFGGLPIVRSTKPLSTFAHTPNLRVSSVHVPPVEGVGFGLVLGFGLPHSPQAETSEKKTRLRTRKRARDWDSFEAILANFLTKQVFGDE